MSRYSAPSSLASRLRPGSGKPVSTSTGIGRGFVAQFLHESGYEVVFADVSDVLIGALQAQPSYLVHEIGDGAQDHVVDGYRAINSRTHEDEVVAAIASADLVTTAVGARILAFVAPVGRSVFHACPS